jgi:hypothetical protein
MNTHEKALVAAFIKKEKKERYLFLLSRAGRRNKVLGKLHHFNDFDPRYVQEMDAQADIESVLRKKGAPDTCYVISDY